MFEKLLNLIGSISDVNVKEGIIDIINWTRDNKVMFFDYPNVSAKDNITIQLNRELTDSEASKLESMIDDEVWSCSFDDGTDNGAPRYWNGKQVMPSLKIMQKDIQGISDNYDKLSALKS